MAWDPESAHAIVTSFQAQAGTSCLLRLGGELTEEGSHEGVPKPGGELTFRGATSSCRDGLLPGPGAGEPGRVTEGQARGEGGRRNPRGASRRRVWSLPTSASRRQPASLQPSGTAPTHFWPYLLARAFIVPPLRAGEAARASTSTCLVVMHCVHARPQGAPLRRWMPNYIVRWLPAAMPRRVSRFSATRPLLT